MTNLVTEKEYTVDVKASCGQTWFTAPETFTLAYTAPVATVSNITDQDAVVSWTAVADADSYLFRGVVKGTGIDWTKATAIPKDNPSVTFSGLSPNAEYDVYVGAVYGEHIEAAEMVSFTSITIAPKNLAVSDIKATSATLTWDYEGAATSFEYALGDDADNLSWLAGESPLALTELLANTSYTFYVRAAYDNGAKSDSIKLTFHTECAAFTIPFEENFNGLTSGTIPECWDNSEGTTTWAAYKWSYYVSGHEGACVRFDSYNNANGNTNILATPAITVDKAAVLKFWCKNYKGGAFEVLISEVGAAERDTLLEELTGIENWTEKEVEIPAKFIGKDVRIFFCGTSNYGFNQNAYSLYVDDVTVTEKPTCLKPTNLTASNVLYNSAELSWTANSGETAWNLEIKVADGEWTPVDAVITNPYALTGLESGKIHYARVQAACTTEDHSEWSNEVSFTPAYKAPTNVIVNNVTTNSATISWTANSGETAWKIQYNKAGSSTAHEEDATANPYVLEGLDSGTSYEVRVVAGTTAFSAYVDFTTTCEAVANLPWSENFESAVTNAAPNCWALLNAQFASKDTRPYIAVAANSGYYQDSKALFFRSEEDFGFAILPEFNMALDTAQITFSHIEDSGIGNLVFGYITDITDASTFVAILECTASSTWKTETAVALTKVPNGVRLAFKHNNAGASYYYDAAVDNILIEAIPACAVPTNLAVLSVTDHSASLSFDSEAESFNYMIRKQGVETWDGGAVTITSTTFTIDELEPNTTYEVTVHAVCAGTSTSSLWTAEVAFTTDCATRTMPYEVAFAEGTPECWTLDGKNDAWKVSNENLRFSANSNVPGVATLPNVHISGTNPVIRLNYSNVYGTRTIAASIHVVAADADSTFTLVDHSALADAELRLDAFVDKDVTITLNLGNTTGTAYFDLKYFNVNNKQFVAPTNVAAVAGIGEATLTWEAGDNETSWEVYYYEKAKEEDQTSYQFITDVTTTSCTISGLANGVTYAARVKAIYEGGTSIGSVAAEFTTLLPQPTALEVSALGAHTATLSWTAAEGVAKYQWSLTEGEWLEANVVETTSVDLTELDANKAYTFFVRSYVSETISSEAISKAFTTDCDVVAMPFVEDFNSLTIGQIPTCWERTDATYTWTYYADGHDGACVRFDSYLNAAGNKDTLATPQIAISGEEPVLNFFFKNPDGGDFTVAIETATDTIALISEGLTGVANWQDTTVALSAYIGQTVRIFFLATSNEHDYAAGVDAHLYLDDVKVIEKPETPTAIDNIFGMDSKNAVKFVENGVLYILRDGVIYNAQGARVNK